MKHDAFTSFVESGKALASTKGMTWDFEIDSTGSSGDGWNLTELAGGRPPTFYLRDLGPDGKTLEHLNAKRLAEKVPPLACTPLNFDWQELIKAATCNQLLFKLNSTSHIAQNVIRPLRVLATCTENREPWRLTADDVANAIDVAKKIQASGKLADTIAGVVKNIFDTNHLAQACPLYPGLRVMRLPGSTTRKSTSVMSKDELLSSLDERKRANRLPDKKAFWELCRIIFTEKPRSFIDAIRFHALKTMVLTALRIGEVTSLPADWARYRDYYDTKGRPAGESGGLSRALLLRHFAEKQQSPNSDSMVLFENLQNVPEMFSKILSDNLNEAAQITQPLRETLRLQIETGRLLPRYGTNDLIPVNELYTVITGNPFWLKLSDCDANNFITKYRESFNPDVLKSLAQFQKNIYKKDEMHGQFDMAMYQFFNRLINKNKDSPENNSIAVRDSTGREYRGGKNWGEAFLNIGELEKYLISSTPTKLPDRKPLRLTNGELQPWELLFLTPKRALSEERNNGITDITQYYSTGIPDVALLSTFLGESKDKQSIFAKYGKTEEDRNLTLISHSLRHLQNSELFKLGVADTIISKRFNRKSVPQSYEYDHRSLAEELESIELPEGIEAMLGEKAATVAKLIKSGRASGPLINEYIRIQREEGDDAAFSFLAVEADGFHPTPYGHCINSFTVEPCPKHLECFAGCCHLTATNLPENVQNLIKLEGKFKVALSEAVARPDGTIGKANQVHHATIRLDNLKKLLSTPTGERAFPEGPDFSKTTTKLSVQDE